MKCGESNCNGDMISIRGTLNLESVSIGTYQLHGVAFWECQKCGSHILPNDTWIAADREKERLLKERIASLPVGDFVSSAKTAQMLGVSKQALHKHRKIGRGFIYSILIDEKKFYHKGSIEQFIQTGDGRFSLVEHKNKSEMVMVNIMIPDPGWSNIQVISTGAHYRESTEQYLARN